MQILKAHSVLILADANAALFEIDDIPAEIQSAAEWLINE